jgi:hypothetical protein
MLLGLVLAVFSVWWVVNRSDGRNGWRMFKMLSQGARGEQREAWRLVLLECVETPFLLNVTGYH